MQAAHGITPGPNVACAVALRCLWPIANPPFSLSLQAVGMIWMLRSTRSGRSFSPYIADNPHLPAINLHCGIKPIHVNFDVASLLQEVVALENEHSLEDDLDGLDDIDVMPESEELLAMGFHEIPWEGGDPHPIVDAKGRIIAIMAGQPSDPGYGSSCMDAFDKIMQEGQAAKFHQSLSNRCRHFPAVNVGISYGKGQKAPCHLQNSILAAVVNRLVGSRAIIQMVTYASASYNLWAPWLHCYYDEHLEALYGKLPHLQGNFPHSVFPCAAFNFGESIWTFKHHDILNCPYGWCAITALGRFDHRQGRHLILWELKLFIQFPHALTIFIPSATITHSNIPPAKGGILCWVDNGFWTEKEMKKADPAAYAAMMARKSMCWEMGLGLLSKLEEVLDMV
ncbi:hypothetical protein F5146DRAFT_1132340 [Armillaria mellea]|nr:hypothetical protein F5146DRAFT_1132340 [Armillaria mellea]